MAEHTLGPWKVTGQPGYAAPLIIAENGRGIAKALYDGGSEDREVDYNARLIAAAPALLAACEAARPILEDYRDFMGSVGAYGQPAELVEDGGYNAIAVSENCQQVLEQLTTAIAAARPAREPVEVE